MFLWHPLPDPVTFAFHFPRTCHCIAKCTANNAFLRKSYIIAIEKFSMDFTRSLFETTNILLISSISDTNITFSVFSWSSLQGFLFPEGIVLPDMSKKKWKHLGNCWKIETDFNLQIRFFHFSLNSEWNCKLIPYELQQANGVHCSYCKSLSPQVLLKRGAFQLFHELFPPSPLN